MTNQPKACLHVTKAAPLASTWGGGASSPTTEGEDILAELASHSVASHVEVS